MRLSSLEASIMRRLTLSKGPWISESWLNLNKEVFLEGEICWDIVKFEHYFRMDGQAKNEH